MSSKELTLAQQLKISCLSRGIRITREAENQLSEGGKVPLSIHEYATTGGITLKLEGDIYVNAPFDEWYCDNPEATLAVDKTTGGYVVYFRGEVFPAHVLPLPGYLEVRDSHGRLVRESVMSHADRARLSPISGCSFSCKFCDSSIRSKYTPKPVDQLLEALVVALRDIRLPVKHVLISGGTPKPRDYDYFDEVCEKVIRSTDLPVDVMMWPRPDNIIERLTEWGIHGYALNLEIYNEEIARQLVPQKRRYGISLYARAIERALQLTGGKGRVRSLILVGLEPEEQTLAGVEFLASLGCDPVLSPFRPAPGTPLQNMRPPSPELLERVYLESLDIVARYGVKLGPRCIPCQHNTLTFPDGSPAYYYS
jgi:uncharacterized radical SAM superfamily protein